MPPLVSPVTPPPALVLGTPGSLSEDLTNARSRARAGLALTAKERLEVRLFITSNVVGAGVGEVERAVDLASLDVALVREVTRMPKTT